MSAPQNQAELRFVLGMIDFFIQFPQIWLNTLLHLITCYRKTVPGPGLPTCKQHLKNSKQSLVTLPILATYDPSIPLGLSCDASEKGLGACLDHVMENGKERSLRYASKCLISSKRNYSQIEKEGLPIVFGTHKFRHYLLGKKFPLRTDHRPFVSLLDVIKVTAPTCSSSRLVRWAFKLSQFDYQIVYQSSASHGNADCLSHLPVNSDDKFDEFRKH